MRAKVEKLKRLFYVSICRLKADPLRDNICTFKCHKQKSDSVVMYKVSKANKYYKFGSQNCTDCDLSSTVRIFKQKVTSRVVLTKQVIHYFEM